MALSLPLQTFTSHLCSVSTGFPWYSGDQSYNFTVIYLLPKEIEVSLSVDWPIFSRLIWNQKFIRVEEGDECWLGLFKLQILFARGLFANMHSCSASSNCHLKNKETPRLIFIEKQLGAPVASRHPISAGRDKRCLNHSPWSWEVNTPKTAYPLGANSCTLGDTQIHSESALLFQFCK